MMLWTLFFAAATATEATPLEPLLALHVSSLSAQGDLQQGLPFRAAVQSAPVVVGGDVGVGIPGRLFAGFSGRGGELSMSDEACPTCGGAVVQLGYLAQLGVPVGPLITTWGYGASYELLVASTRDAVGRRERLPSAIPSRLTVGVGVALSRVLVSTYASIEYGLPLTEPDAFAGVRLYDKASLHVWFGAGLRVSWPLRRDAAHPR
jgi:hypothetical protein